MTSISGKELHLWHCSARQQAIAHNLNPDEVDWLLRAVTDLSSLSLRIGSYQEQVKIHSQQSLSELDRLWQQRLQKRVPVQYLAGTVFWRRFQLKVTPDVLIPRPETELIIDLVQEATQKTNLNSTIAEHWVDLGTGSGAIALGLAEVFPSATIHGVDCSPNALKVAQANAASLKLETQIRFYGGDWWGPLAHLKGQVQGMVANPPYIPTREIAQLQPEVGQHEPKLALDGGEDGLDDIRHLVASAPEYLVSGGIWLVEMAIGQGESVVELLKQQGAYEKIQVFADFNGIDRFVLAYRR